MQKKDSYSKIIAGTMTWGSWGKQFSKAESAALINFCLENGISTFDHADIYGDYTNEAEFGRALIESNVPREKIQLISKCGIQFSAESRNNRVKHYDYSTDYIIWSVERSLHNLKTDYLDMLLLHRPSPLMQPSEIAEAVNKLQAAGKIRDFGVSNFSPSQIELLEKEIEIDANQVEFSLTQNRAMNDGTLDDIMANDRIAMSWSPLGAYFKEDSPAISKIGHCLENLCEKYAATEDQLLLAWIMKHPSRIKPVVGTTTEARLTMAAKAVQIEIELQDWFILLEAANGNEVP
ncbi:putative oxidoreductase [Flavobacteriaceae bacterium MAR_2009_75]|nr:putative oxidoreductase [Flavobacteriaceae bacterium MAR_2009_75]